ncbi:MAG: hypothetical protein WAK20_09460 [Candidatus Acidiferrum sp.]
MKTPENLAEVIGRLNEAADLMKSAALAADRNPATKPAGIRLSKMSDEAESYGRYLGAYFGQPEGRT